MKAAGAFSLPALGVSRRQRSIKLLAYETGAGDSFTPSLRADAVGALVARLRHALTPPAAGAVTLKVD